MESQKKMMVVFGLVAAVCLQCVAEPTVHVVEKSAWTVPPILPFLPDQKFVVGDVLTFNLKDANDVVEVAKDVNDVAEGAKAVYEVAKVTKDGYDHCNNINQMGQIPSTHFPLNYTGEHYFICPSGSHCQSGLKLVVNVLASGTSPGSSPSAPSTSTTTSTASSSSPAAGAGFVLCLLSLVVGLFV